MLAEVISVLGDRIKLCRKKMKLTQIELAEMLNVSQGSVTSWETEVRKPDIEMISKLADVFGVTTDYLLGRDSKSSIDPQPDAIAAHTDQAMTPELRAEIDKYVQQALHKYMPKDDNSKR